MTAKPSASKAARAAKSQIRDLTRERLGVLAGTFEPTGMVACTGLGSTGHPDHECEHCGIRWDRQHQAGKIARQIRQLKEGLPHATQPAQMVLW